MIIYITSLFIFFKKQRKRGLKFCGYLPISRILQTSSMPAALLQRREVPCLIRLLFFIPKLLLSQGSPLRTLEPCLSHTASLPAASKQPDSTWEHSRYTKPHGNSVTCSSRAQKLSWNFLVPDVFVNAQFYLGPVLRDRYLSQVINTSLYLMLVLPHRYHMDKQEIWGL